jgi:hypothetical protein
MRPSAMFERTIAGVYATVFCPFEVRIGVRLATFDVLGHNHVLRQWHVHHFKCLGSVPPRSCTWNQTDETFGGTFTHRSLR